MADKEDKTPDPQQPDPEARVKALIDESVKSAVSSALSEFVAGLPKGGGDSGPAPRKTHAPEQKSIFQTLFGTYGG